MADDFLRATGLVLIAQAWARAAAVSGHAAHADDPFHRVKCETARHCFAYVLPELEHALCMVTAAAAPLAMLPVPA